MRPRPGLSDGAVRELGPSGVVALVGALRDPEGAVRVEAARALGAVGFVGSGPRPRPHCSRLSAIRASRCAGPRPRPSFEIGLHAPEDVTSPGRRPGQHGRLRSRLRSFQPRGDGGGRAGRGAGPDRGPRSRRRLRPGRGVYRPGQDGSRRGRGGAGARGRARRAPTRSGGGRPRGCSGASGPARGPRSAGLCAWRSRSDPDERVRANAARALGRIDPKAWADVLRGAQEDGDEAVRREADRGARRRGAEPQW